MRKTGYRMPQLRKDIISAANKGRKHTKKEREKMRLAKLGKKRLPFSDETRQKMSDFQKSRYRSPMGEAHMAKFVAGRVRYQEELRVFNKKRREAKAKVKL